ncbi:prenyltransferase [Streptomyces bambusae]|uniref:tryptophan dimethylallyltransferase family protein n=1 Tax=Streptomyces bambusae TaxID=1550616 RepID=UPI001CFCE602|nr:tryptophan dimethylallyltransferase family protein [Streptomyces bambusae]MCB5168364.1 prenyltransferase [Streptomyces bambusae]
MPASIGWAVSGTRLPRQVSARAARPAALRPETGGTPDARQPPETLGGHAARQLLRLCETTGLGAPDSVAYAQTLLTALGPAAERSLALPPAYPSLLSDDHTPVEFSLSCTPDADPTLRVLLEPGYGAGGTAANGRAGLAAVRGMARRWGFDTARLDELEDLFFPPSPQGPLALWCALELVPGGIPKVKVYLNPAASGRERSTTTVREALRRLGHDRAYASLPRGDRPLFFALDLGDWDEPRVKVYLAHHELTGAEAAGLSRVPGGPARAEVEGFFAAAAGSGADGGPGGGPRLRRRPVQSCHAFTETAAGRPSGFTLYVPVRDYARHDGEALDRALAVLERQGIDPGPLLRSLAAVTSRRLQDGVGLIAYLGLAHQEGRSPRVTAYLSSEAYAVRPPVRSPQTSRSSRR